jgi:CubicO group peptidase (beta-lactamase class C family)
MYKLITILKHTSLVLKLVAMVALCVTFTAVRAEETNEELAQRIDTYLNASAENGFSGAVLVARKGEIVLSKGYGFADREKKLPVTPATVFNIGSITKQFTAAAILRLVEQEKLKVTDTLEVFFPDAPEDKKDITIHQLLTHTGGISPNTGGFRYDDSTRENFLRIFFSAPLVRLPGTKHEYTNAGYTVLAAIIEKASGESYEKFLNRELFKKAGLQSTGYTIPNWEEFEIARGYRFDLSAAEWTDWGTTMDYFMDGDKVSWFGVGKGDIQSTTEDLYRWHRALTSNSVLAPKTKTIMETPYVKENPRGTSHYAYGWGIFTSRQKTKIVAHDGSNEIYFADFLRYVEDEFVVIALTNVRKAESERIGWNIGRMGFNSGYDPRPIPKSSYELVYEFMEQNSPENVEELRGFFRSNGHPVFRSRAILNQIGMQLMREKKWEWSIALLKVNTQIFRGDGNLWDSLGEAYLASGDNEMAIKSFKEALRLAPDSNCYWCENATSRLSALGKTSQ